MDFDGDGRTDFSVLRFPSIPPPAAAQITYYNQNSTSGFQAANFGDANTDFPVPGDYDGDGKEDYAVARTGATATSPVTWYVLQSAAGFRAQQFGISSDVMVQGDYDGDARTDIAIYRRGATATSASTFWVLQSFSLTALGMEWGLRPDFPVATYNAR